MPQQKLPVWDLKDLYHSPTDPKLNADSAGALREALAFGRRYRGKLGAIARSPQKLLRALESFELIIQRSTKPVEYAYLRFAESSTDSTRGALLQNTQEASLRTSRELTFFELELLALAPAILKRAIKTPQLARFANFLKKLVDSKPHRLSEREEQLIQDKRLTGSGAFTRLFDEEFAAKAFLVALPGGKKQLNESQTLDLLYHPKRPVRKAAAQGFSAGLRAEARRLTLIFNVIAQDKSVDDRYLNFPTPEASRHLSNQISQGAVDAMVSSVTENTDLVARYYKLKAKLLGLPVIEDFDRYAPMPFGARERISFAAARKIITESAQRFSPRYAEIVDEFFARRWIHAAQTPGKRSGAFCSFATADTHPYVFVNFSGSLKEVLTLAHELGHAVHAYLMRDQGYLNFGVPLTIAETASVFGEMLVFEHLRKSIADRRELLSLYCSKIEGMFATVFRQVAMHRFEGSLHAARRKQGELSTADLSRFWLEHQRSMFGSSVRLNPDYEMWWSYIPHFLHSPFYVYAYAFGELLTVALFARYKQALQDANEENFVRRYLAMLAAGDSKSPAELVKPFGIRLEDKNFWLGGISVLRDMVRTIEQLAKD